MNGKCLAMGVFLFLLFLAAAGTGQASETAPEREKCVQQVKDFLFPIMKNTTYACEEKNDRLFLFRLGRMLPAREGIYHRADDGGETFSVTKGGYIFNRDRR